MRVWRFYEYVDATGRNALRVWISGRPKHTARLDILLAHLATIPDSKYWDTGETNTPFKWLTKVKAQLGLGEIRFHVDGLAQRPAGCLGNAPSTFVLLVGCDKQGNRYFPPDAFGQAAKARDEYRAGIGTVVERQVP